MKKYLLLMLIASSNLQAAIFNVSTTPELRGALDTAATNGEDDTIILADGTYKTTDDGEGTFIYLSNESNTLTLQGSSADNAAMSGDNTHRVFHHQSSSSEGMLNGLTLKKLSFADGTTDTNSYGAGVFTAHNVVVLGCNFENNHGIWGGGLRVLGGETSITDSQFLNNSANGQWGHGGGVSTQSGMVTVTNSKFINNSSSDRGAGIAQNASGTGYYLLVEGTTFKDNASYLRGGAIDSSAPSIIKNSIFTGNSSPEGGAVNSSKTTVLNSIFLSNTNTLYVTSNIMTYVVNSIFDGDITYSIGGSGSALLSVNNSFLDLSSLSLVAFEENNIYSEVNLGFVDAENGDYRLTDSSDLVNAGTIDVEGIDFPETDMDGNYRISGATIDIGPYEYPLTAPTVTSLNYSGKLKEQVELTFIVNYTLSEGRSIKSIEYDYLDNGVYTSSDTSTYNTSGTYTVTVKVTDDSGEFSTSGLDIVIDELPWNEMTYEQKLVKAIFPEYYDSLLVQIDLEKSNSVAVAVTSATNTGVATGKQYVQDNLTEFNLIPVPTDEMIELLNNAKDNLLLDINGDGKVNLPIDGFIILRHMVGFPASELASDEDMTDATRTRDEIKSYMESF
jgi:hypothetical protein